MGDGAVARAHGRGIGGRGGEMRSADMQFTQTHAGAGDPGLHGADGDVDYMGMDVDDDAGWRKTKTRHDRRL